MNYVVISVLREICNLIGTLVRNSGEESGTGSDTDTIPYGVGDEADFDLPMFSFHLNSLLVQVLTELLLGTICWVLVPYE